MKRLSLFLCAILLLIPGTGMAGPILLEYSVTDINDGLYQYEFELILDNQDNSWTQGQAWDLVIFGDASEGESPLTDFTGDASDLPIGPFTEYGTTSGSHNGFTLRTNSGFWAPLVLGESLLWSGTSTAHLGQGDLLYSLLSSDNAALNTEFAVATLHMPEPGTLVFVGTGLTVLLSWIRQRRFSRPSRQRRKRG